MRFYRERVMFFGLHAIPVSDEWKCEDKRACAWHEYPGMAYLLWKEKVEAYESQWHIKLWRKIQRVGQ